jgi:hypothetical protein
MAVNATTLAAPVDFSSIDLSVASATGAAKDRIVKIEDEYAVVTKVVGTIVTVRSRGDHGTSARAHNILAPVVFGDATDFPANVPPARHRAQMQEIDGIVYYGASGAIDVPTKDTTVVLAGAAVLAMTLADPSRFMDGVKLRIIAAGAAAHTVTSATGFNAGGAAVDVATFAAAVGNNLVLEAVSGKWVVRSSLGITLA